MALLVVLNVMAARGRERTVTTTQAESERPALGTDALVNHGRNLFSAKGCVSCHVTIAVGPSLTDIKDRAEKTKKGFTAEQYVRESILAPSAFKAPGPNGNQSNEMPTLPVNAAELDALVAYVLTL
ncbi:MAG: c-type cytochrome [Acidimicrobiales bacterium]